MTIVAQVLLAAAVPEPIEVSVATGWPDLVVAVVPSVLAALVAVAVVYLSGRLQQRSQDRDFRRSLRAQLYRDALSACQEKLYLFIVISEQPQGSTVPPAVTGQASEAVAKVRELQAQCIALASAEFARSIEAIAELEPLSPGASADSVDAFRESVDELLGNLASVVRKEMSIDMVM